MCSEHIKHYTMQLHVLNLKYNDTIIRASTQSMLKQQQWGELKTIIETHASITSFSLGNNNNNNSRASPI